MQRREFIRLLGGAAAAWPLAARGQQPVRRVPRIGVIDDAPNWDHFRQGLRDLGYVVGQNVTIEYRSAQDNVDRLTRAAVETCFSTDGRDRRARLACDAGGATSHSYDSHHHAWGWRSGESGFCHESGPARWKHHRKFNSSTRADRQAARDSERVRSRLSSRGLPLESRQQLKSCLFGGIDHRCSIARPSVDFRSNAHE